MKIATCLSCRNVIGITAAPPKQTKRTSKKESSKPKQKRLPSPDMASSQTSSFGGFEAYEGDASSSDSRHNTSMDNRYVVV